MNLFTAFTCLGIVAFVCSANTPTGSNVVRKCCDFNEVFENSNGTYNCTEDVTKRRQIKTEDTGFLYTNSTGVCAEITEEFFIFNVSQDDVVALGQAVEKVFPKCCPLGQVYNSVLHSCEERDDLNQTYIQESFLQIGLSNCKVIVDYELAGTVDFQYGLQDSNYSIHRRNSLEAISSYCIDKTNVDGFVLRECKDSIEVCEEIRCFKKCCPDGQSFVGGDHCQDTYEFGLNVSKWAGAIENSKDPFGIIYNRTCTSIFLVKEDKYHFAIDSKGTFSYYTNNTPLTIEDLGEMNSYCMEHVQANAIHGYQLFKCFGEADIEEKFQYTHYAFMLSCIFLTLTITVYIVLNEVRKVFGKILVLYCIAMLLEAGTLTYVSSNFVPADGECQIIAFAIILFGCASFSWSNVLCWDIWCTFGSTKSYIGTSQKSKDLMKILFYTLYGWGIPLALTFLIWIFYKFDDILPATIQPHLAVERCFFEIIAENYAKAVFLNFPMLVMELVNIIFFFKTVSYCLKVRNEINKINDTTRNDKAKKYKRDKERLFLILKLSIIMGISFIFEAVSGFLDMGNMGTTAKYVEMIWDIINALQGLYIFVIFICKKKILDSLTKKVIKVHLPQVSTSTQSSHTNNGVSLQSMDTLPTRK